MSREKYSNGFNSAVYKVDHVDKKRFPNADLIRIDNSSKDRHWFGRLYYRHKIAHLLYPDNFINVVAVTVDSFKIDSFEEVSYSGSFNKEVELFSKVAPVSPDHAIYSSHMRINPDTRNKESMCECSICLAHREVHSQDIFMQRPRELAIKMRKAGFIPAWDDESDFCLNQNTNDLLFFELGNYHENEVVEHLSSLAIPKENERRALVLALRHNELVKQSRDDIRSGVSQEMRLN